MTIYKALKKDHRRVLHLLDELITGERQDLAKRRELLSQINHELIPHSRAEEALLYNPLRDVAQAKGIVTHSYKDHIEAETLLRSLQVMEAVDVHWVSGVQKLKDALAKHIEDEEGRVFREAQRMYTDADAELIGEAFIHLKTQIKKGGLAATTLELVTNLMPASVRPSVRSFLSTYEEKHEGPTAKAS